VESKLIEPMEIPLTPTQKESWWQQKLPECEVVTFWCTECSTRLATETTSLLQHRINEHLARAFATDAEDKALQRRIIE
jgi:hypothetical protein